MPFLSQLIVKPVNPDLNKRFFFKGKCLLRWDKVAVGMWNWKLAKTNAMACINATIVFICALEAETTEKKTNKKNK